MEKLRVGVIGLGVMGMVHAEIYGQIDNVELVGLVESFPVVREKAEKRFKVPCFSTFDELIALGVDAVSVCTPDNMHKDFLLKSFEHGIKVLVEKPLEVSSVLCDEILAAMPDETYIMVGHTMRFDARIIQAKQHLMEGKIGKIVAAKINRCNVKANGARVGKRTNVAWFLGIHDADLLLWLLDDEVVAANGYGVKVFSEYEDYFVGNALLRSGVIATFENHWLLPDTCYNRMDARLSIIGEKGMITVDMCPTNVCVSADAGNSRFYDSFLQYVDLNGLTRGDILTEIQSFAECVIQNKIPPVTAKQAARAVRAIEMMTANSMF